MAYSDLKDKLIINNVNNNMCYNNYCRIVDLVPAIDDNYCDSDTFPDATNYHEDCSITSTDTYTAEDHIFNYQIPQYFVKNQTKLEDGKRVAIKHPCLVVKRNARERCRVRAVNEAYARLRVIVPSLAGRHKRVSKVKTLQRTIQYIKELCNLLDFKVINK